MMNLDFAPFIEKLYRELDTARTAIDIDTVPSLRLQAVLRRYDRLRLQARDQADQPSLEATCAVLAPLYGAVNDFDSVLRSWMKTDDPDYDGPMTALAFNPFHGFFREVLEAWPGLSNPSWPGSPIRGH
jgi:hypothetical protein